MNPKYQTITIQSVLKIICALISAVLVLLGIALMLLRPHPGEVIEKANDVGIIDGLDFYLYDSVAEAKYATQTVKKRFWLNDDAKKGPVPNPELYGTSDDPSSLQWLLDDAQSLLDGESTLFTTETPLISGTKATYYLDETIFAVTWKQAFHRTCYTITEIKVSDPSQFRRHLEDSVFDGPKLSTPTKMSRKVNAVVGTSADHYRGRKAGIVVYDGEVKRVNRLNKIDVCYIDENGDLKFTYRDQIKDFEGAQKFVDDNNISFSISFGPILIDDGKRCEPPSYNLGEVNDNYARAALCQMGPLHYLVVVANAEGRNPYSPTIHDFAATLDTFGCQKAYTLDGGNTGSIVMNGKLINRTPFGYQRSQGDLIYFATALPETK